MSKGIVSGLVLLTIGLVAGFLLAFVNSFTAPKILAYEQQLKYDAIGEFYDLSTYTITEVPVTTGGAVDTLYKVLDGNTTVAIVYSVKSFGYQSEIKMLIAIKSDLTVEGYKIVDQAETSGYGTQAPDHDFQMDGAAVGDLSTFDAIAGVTYTSNAVKACFTAVFDRAATDFGGDAS
ncbi:MAG: FMN-binding protein [Candidatus Izemoplasmatales bacterium]